MTPRRRRPRERSRQPTLLEEASRRIDPAAKLPNRFRRRLTIAFVVVAGVASAILAAGSYFSASHYRRATMADRATHQAEVNLALSAGAETPAQLDQLFDVYRERGEVESLALAPDGTERSSLRSLTSDQIPPALRGGLTDEIVQTTTVARGVRYLVVAGQPPGSPLELYFFFSREAVLSSLETMRTNLIVGWLLIVTLAGLVGAAIARATLAPVRTAAQAAHSLAEGLLSTRLSPETDDEFGALAEHFNHMAEALEQKISALSEARDRERRFTAFAAHELRTPLTAMSTACSLLEEDVDRLPERARRPAQLVIADVARLRRLVLNLLELGRLDSPEDWVEVESVHLDDLVARTVSSGRWDVDVGLDLVPVTVISDAWSLERIVANLVANAVRHGREGVTVQVRAAAGGAAVIEVCDRGPGIASEEVSHIFERFYTAGRSSGGTGLGLAIVREHVQRIGATVDIQTELGHGTCVVVSVPPSAAPGPVGGAPNGVSTTVSSPGHRS